MTTRAAINVLGSDGSLIDIASLGVDTVTTSHPSQGVYLVHGTLGMAPPPEGWGYVINQVDADKTVDIQFADGVLTVSTTLAGEPADLAHSITLHLCVEEVPPAPEPPLNPLAVAQDQMNRLRTQADRAIAPLQDAVDIEEATEEEVAILKLWKKFRVALSRIPEQADYPDAIDWPVVPA
ncbi:tail fiber assembly domain protein [Pseudomonas synxantha]|uniref:tail fiber assembly protein n=1 Tax=Pseudomonas synxantha TaxID=47883 RepID=UPI000F58F032|nr:tail fiber assembly protein [Pseudomonas synxantha]AZE73136.1 tail fiber assembly domain protein [Pseudomonas synxantha]